MNSRHVHDRLVFSSPVELTLKPTRFSREHDGRRQVTCVKIDVMLDGRIVAARDFRFDQGQAVLGSTIFDDPVRLALAVDKWTRRNRSMLWVSIAAALTTPEQESELLEIERTVSGDLGLWTLPDQQVGLFLGDRWFPVRAGAPIQMPVGPDPAAGPRPFTQHAAGSSPGSMMANLSKEVERLLAVHTRSLAEARYAPAMPNQ